MATLSSNLVLWSPGAPTQRPVGGYNSRSVVILVSFKRAPCSGRSARRRAEHDHDHRSLLQSRAARCRNARARTLGCKAQFDSAGLGLETNGAALKSEERLLPGKQSEENRLQSVRGTDFAGASISSQVWEWRHRWNIHYESAGMENADAPALLLLPGFGVGSYHYEHQLRELGQEYRVWAMDFLGQGRSWPSHDPAPLEEVVEEEDAKSSREWCCGKTPESWASDLVYSVDTWRDQVHAFIDKVIGGPVYVVGNSLGGYVGTYFAATSPGLVKGLALLNATPFWAFMPNARRYPLLSRFVPWAGLLPVPVVAKAAVRVWWNLLRNPKVIQRALEMVYADQVAFNEKLVRQMLEATDHPAAFAAFASILFAPRAHTDFGENLISLKERKMPMCMIYGKEDPWVVPFWGQRAKQKNPDAVYYELSPAGHCPHHEAPEVVNTLLRKWVESVQSQGALSPPLLEGGVDPKQHHWFVIEDSSAGFHVKRVSVRVKGTQGFWRNLLDSIREIFSKRVSRQSQVVETVEKNR